MTERTQSGPTSVVNQGEPYDVYIGRPSKWGNPFTIGAHGGRDCVISKYREWIMRQPHLLADLGELRGKRLGCYCKPLPCHGDVLAELANEHDQERQKGRELAFTLALARLYDAVTSENFSRTGKREMSTNLRVALDGAREVLDGPRAAEGVSK